MPNRVSHQSLSPRLAFAWADKGTGMSSTTPKAAATAAVFIGVHSTMVDALAPRHDRTVSASDSPQYPRKHGTPEEWLSTVRGIISKSDGAESPVLAEAMTLATMGKRCTVYVATLSLGVKAPAGSPKMFDQYPTVAAADGWAQFVSIARAMGATIISL
jgi:hypothetical protein